MKFPIEITPMQLCVYLQFAIAYSEEHDAELPLCKEIVKTIMSVHWDKDAILTIDEMPF